MNTKYCVIYGKFFLNPPGYHQGQVSFEEETNQLIFTITKNGHWLSFTIFKEDIIFESDSKNECIKKADILNLFS